MGPASSWKTVVPCPITTSRRNPLCTWCCVCGVVLHGFDKGILHALLPLESLDWLMGGARRAPSVIGITCLVQHLAREAMQKQRRSYKKGSCEKDGSKSK